MYEILIWSDADGDFIVFRHQKRVIFNTWAEASDFAAGLAAETGEQCRVQFVRNTKKPKKTMKNGRLQRFPAVQFDGEWVRVIATIDSMGRKIK